MSINTHQTRTGSTTDDWITPKRFIDELGPFDLDPCASVTQPWPCAYQSYTRMEDGLLRPWEGRVWLNPPYGGQLEVWMERLADHNEGIAITFARTETKTFHRHVWPRASGILFLRGRPRFHFPDGSSPAGDCGGAMCLISYGDGCRKRLQRCEIEGRFLTV